MVEIRPIIEKTRITAVTAGRNLYFLREIVLFAEVASDIVNILSGKDFVVSGFDRCLRLYIYR